MIISIAGQAGSGKSTIAQKLAKKLGWQYYDMGTIRRLKAKSLKLSLAEYNKLGENNPQSDLELDQYQKNLSKTLDNFVISGRTSWHFIPNSIKIYLDVEANVGAKRVWLELKKKNSRNEDKNLKTIEDVIKSQQQRIKSDIKRYKKYYQINVYNHKNYDYILDTTSLNKKQVFDNIYNYTKKQLIIDK
ncbi:cytidylate kinase family protein [Patescibacteria group bacterium]|nr:cytidylate kinase family protein [Patescibacteria group bacterium]MBU0879658.1 cytidylate kinase family protein [Patescibacteria group bacterium]MBU0880545.1 cytidylate kinase family protein [Patescibacteria group bacterium]MBU1062770.1 cytidylate kinase family protein [Patescibacteria group bacterium]MBU1783053.1 cytidylate kinase family protein [Patescibacteria group bacterium]